MMRKELIECLKIHANDEKDISFETTDDILALYDDEILLGTHPKEALKLSLKAIAELKTDKKTNEDKK